MRSSLLRHQHLRTAQITRFEGCFFAPSRVHFADQIWGNFDAGDRPTFDVLGRHDDRQCESVWPSGDSSSQRTGDNEWCTNSTSRTAIYRTAIWVHFPVNFMIVLYSCLLLDLLADLVLAFNREVDLLEIAHTFEVCTWDVMNCTWNFPWERLARF